MQGSVNNEATVASQQWMTLSINLTNLHYDKQTFQVSKRLGESERSDADPHAIRSRICAVSTRWPLKQVQKNGETLKIRALHSSRNFCGISVITSGVQSGSSQHTADSAEKSCRCPLLFSTTPIHDPSLARKKERERQYRDSIRPR